MERVGEKVELSDNQENNRGNNFKGGKESFLNVQFFLLLMLKLYLFFGFLVFLLLASTSNSQSWLMFKYDFNHTRISTTTPAEMNEMIFTKSLGLYNQAYDKITE